MYTPGDLVFAKVKGYCPWPGQIMCQVSTNKFKVFFYGTRQESLVDIDCIWSSVGNLASFSRQYGGRTDYCRALEEMENKPNLFAVHEDDLCSHKCITCDQKRKLDGSLLTSMKKVKVNLNKLSENKLVYKIQDNDEWPQEKYNKMKTNGITEDLAQLDLNEMKREATQPVEALDNFEDVQEKTKIWGQLYPHCGTFPRIPLSTDSFKLGRGKSSDYVIKESDMGSSKWLTAISQNQCEILKMSTGIFIKDCSSNGTWVNGHKVGKNLMRPLEHNAEICFANAKMKVFVFISTTDGEKFPVKLTDKYTISKVLGRGAFGEVRLAFRIPDLYRVAIKIITKKTTAMISSSANIPNEVEILQTVNHPCLIALEDVIETKEYLFLILELAEGGELFDKIMEKTKFNEAEAKLHFYQIVSAIKYLHQKNICHRDLKLENVLLCSEDNNNPIVKITDMGLSKFVFLGTGEDLGAGLKTVCGTPSYMAPEVVMAGILGNYSLKVDCWSLGVILFILLSGTIPFSENRICGANMRMQIITANYKFHPKLWNQIDDKAKDLIEKLLKVNPDERLSAAEILMHPWLQDQIIIDKAERLMQLQADKKAQRNISEEKRLCGVKRGARDEDDGQENRMRQKCSKASYHI